MEYSEQENNDNENGYQSSKHVGGEFFCQSVKGKKKKTIKEIGPELNRNGGPAHVSRRVSRQRMNSIPIEQATGTVIGLPFKECAKRIPASGEAARG